MGKWPEGNQRSPNNDQYLCHVDLPNGQCLVAKDCSVLVFLASL